MVKSEFIRYCAKRAGFTYGAMELAFKTIIDSIVDLVSIGEKVHINDFGEFYLKECAPRTGRNVYTNEEFKIPARIMPGFTFGRGFKRAVETAQNREE